MPGIPVPLLLIADYGIMRDTHILRTSTRTVNQLPTRRALPRML